ncbi:MAG: CBS domain-containing protein [Cellulosilyticum sp.]|nr:CBS domain-containing protein [Cellulosilyticum sp.]
MRAKDVMIKNVIFIKKEDKLEEIISVLMQNHVSGVPVLDKENHLVGMVTEKDLVTKEKGLNISSYMEFMASIFFIDGKLLRSVNKKKIETLTAADVMSTPVYAVHLEATIEEIVSLMMNRHINRIPVIDKENKLVGIIGRNDLLPILIK